MLADRAIYPKLEIASAVLALVLGLASYAVLAGRATPMVGFSPPATALMLVVTLVSVIVLVLLIGRRVLVLVANRRAGRAGSRLHLKLVALFAAVAAAPTLLMVGFAALLFQYGVQFYFTPRVQAVLINSDTISHAYVAENQRRLIADLPVMVGDLARDADAFGIDSAKFQQSFIVQTAGRNLSESAIFLLRPEGPRMVVSTGPDPATLAKLLTQTDLRVSQDGSPRLLSQSYGRVAAIIKMSPSLPLYIYASRGDPKLVAAATLSRSALDDYARLIAKSRQLQFRFNAMLAVVSLLLLAAAIWAALRLATRLVTPIERLALAAERVGRGDLSARVALSGADEISVLSRAFNRMAAQLGVQQRALLQAGEQIDTRRRLTEAVFAGVSAGVVALDGNGVVRTLNASAAELLGIDAQAIGTALHVLAPELAEMVDRAAVGGAMRGEITIARGVDTQTLAVRVVRAGAEVEGVVVTFDDISAQLADQRRAAWADVARRIAHEIKNPLTPIQLSAERLQRKFGCQIAADADVFGQLTGTIVRQVGDLRRMVDEFSAFARMPRPEFAPADLNDIARQAVLLQEIAFPSIRFSFRSTIAEPAVCDRRQIAQALTNVLQNAAQSVATRQERDGGMGHISLTLARDGGAILLSVADNGVGLPAEHRARLTEPYVTTRVKGTGLGLAIVQKIVEDHHGSLDLADNLDGGAKVTMRVPATSLASAVLPELQAAE